MDTVRPVFKKLLIAAIIVYVAGTAALLSDLFEKVGKLEFDMMHITGKCAIPHK
jgi:hypothetical protein